LSSRIAIFKSSAILAGGGGRVLRTNVAAVSSSTPVGSPLASSRTITPPSGFGVSRVMPASSSAFEFTVTTWPPRGMNTGLPGETLSSSTRVGIRPSARMALVPAGRGHHPSPGRRARNALADRSLHLGDRARAKQLNRRAVEPGKQLMQMGIDQPRHDSLAGKLDHLRRRADMAGHRGVVADREEAAILDRDRLRDAPILVDRDHLAAAQHEVRRLRERGGRNGAEDDGNERREPQTHESLRTGSRSPPAAPTRGGSTAAARPKVADTIVIVRVPVNASGVPVGMPVHPPLNSAIGPISEGLRPAGAHLSAKRHLRRNRDGREDRGRKQ
jgi:hypothetical protein